MRAFGLSGYNHAAAGKFVGELDGGGIEELLDSIPWAGDLISDGLMGHVHFERVASWLSVSWTVKSKAAQPLSECLDD